MASFVGKAKVKAKKIVQSQRVPLNETHRVSKTYIPDNDIFVKELTSEEIKIIYDKEFKKNDSFALDMFGLGLMIFMSSMYLASIW